jgi:hypothetical protein
MRSLLRTAAVAAIVLSAVSAACLAQATGADATGGSMTGSGSGVCGHGAATTSRSQPQISPQSNHASGTPGLAPGGSAPPSRAENKNNTAGPVTQQGSGGNTDVCNTGTACGE